MIFHSWSAVFEHVKRSPEILFLTPSWRWIKGWVLWRKLVKEKNQLSWLNYFVCPDSTLAFCVPKWRFRFNMNFHISRWIRIQLLYWFISAVVGLGCCMIFIFCREKELLSKCIVQTSPCGGSSVVELGLSRLRAHGLSSSRLQLSKIVAHGL